MFDSFDLGERILDSGEQQREARHFAEYNADPANNDVAGVVNGLSLPVRSQGRNNLPKLSAAMAKENVELRELLAMARLCIEPGATPNPEFENLCECTLEGVNAALQPEPAQSNRPDLCVRWHKNYKHDYWMPIRRCMKHTNDKMAEFYVEIIGVADDKFRWKAEGALAARLAILMNLSSGIPTAKLWKELG